MAKKHKLVEIDWPEFGEGASPPKPDPTEFVARIDAVRGRMDQAGLKTIIYTDTARDGMLDGVNADAMNRMCEAVTCNVVASGGVSSDGDVRRLKGLNRENLVGAIVGKALYDKRVDLGTLQSI